ncbi:MAG: hypothetical protein M3381_00740 [Actinomycetota bacterium]|nr:hypothetical protein [Actinomycetota bacterium]
MTQPPYGNQPPYGGQPNPGGSQPDWGQPNPAGQPGYGPPTGATPDYGQSPTVAQPSFGQPTRQYGQPAFGGGGGGGGGYGPPPGGPPPYGGGPGAPFGGPEPAKKNPLPFIIIGLIVLLIVGGVGLFFALDDGAPTPVATTTSPALTSEDTDTPTEDTETPTEDTDTDTDTPSGDDPNFAESEVVAADFVQLMIDGDYDTALSALCEDGRDPSDGDGFADGQALADDFFTEIGATTITDGQLVGVASSGDSDRDVVTFDLETEVGTVGFEVQVLEEVIGADLTICGYDSL